jgi:(R)-amidase
MKVEFAQLAGRDNGTAYNLERALAAIAASAVDTQLIVFPETHLMGFPSAETVADIAEPLDGPTVQAIIDACRVRGIAVVIGMAESEAGQFYNTTVLITPDGIALRYRKTHLWASDRGVFTPGDRYATCLWNGVRVGLLIVTNGNMDPYGPTHRTAIMARAQENQAFALMVNRVEEGDGGLLFAGGSALVDPFGTLLFEAGREEGQFTVELDLDQLAAARKDYRYLDDQRLKLPGEVIERSDGTRELLIPRP